MQRILEILTEIASAAGQIIMEVYAQADFAVEQKSDRSPITIADRRSHQFITAQLQSHFPHIPIISEEAQLIPYAQRRRWQQFWLVDPLDGTKEFISRNGEFTVNIGLVENGKPVAGVVYAPAKELMYWGAEALGAWRKYGKEIQELRSLVRSHNGLVAVGSRSHAGAKEQEVFQQLGVVAVRRIGSALKFGLVAEKQADLYYRSSPVWEWDTAAGHAVLRSVGGEVLSRGKTLQYNKPELKHPDGFVGVADLRLLEKYPLLRQL